MNTDTRSLLEGIIPYFKMLEKINERTLKLIEGNMKNEPEENLELLYVILSDLMRIFPIRHPWDEESKCRVFTEYEVDVESGILLLREYIPFIFERYNEILLKNGSFELFSTIAKIRNKYTHEPHNIRFGCAVGSVNDYAAVVIYKKNSFIIGTSQLIDVISKLNDIFEDIRQVCLRRMETCDSKYKEYPCYIYILKTNLLKFNEIFEGIPWRDYCCFQDDE